MPTESIGGEEKSRNEDQPEVWSNYQIEEFLEKLKDIKTVRVEPDEIAVLETTMGTIKFKFYPDEAPNHCASFKRLANCGFYDWTAFHRVAVNFVIQGGDIYSKNDDPSDDGSGDPGFMLDAEFSYLSHKRGMVSTARLAHDINSGSSQFFIMLKPHPRLNGEYTVFAEVIEGMEVVDAIAEVPVRLSRPLEPIYIKKATVVKEEE
ncbi:peptidylprolyl isomerase [candidate division KSB1 bacterium]